MVTDGTRKCYAGGTKTTVRGFTCERRLTPSSSPFFSSATSERGVESHLPRPPRVWLSSPARPGPGATRAGDAPSSERSCRRCSPCRNPWAGRSESAPRPSSAWARAAYDRYTKHRDALPHYRAALDHLDHAPALPEGRHDELRDKILHGLVACQKELGNLEACRLLHGEIVALRRRGCGPKQGKVGWSLWRLARVEEKLGRFSEAPRPREGSPGDPRKDLDGGRRGPPPAPRPLPEAPRQVGRRRILVRRRPVHPGGPSPGRASPEGPKHPPGPRRDAPAPGGPLRPSWRRSAASSPREPPWTSETPRTARPLHHVAAKGDDPSMLAVARLLLKAGADPNSPSERHRSHPPPESRRGRKRGHVPRPPRGRRPSGHAGRHGTHAHLHRRLLRPGSRGAPLHRTGRRRRRREQGRGAAPAHRLQRQPLSRPGRGGGRPREGRRRRERPGRRRREPLSSPP